MLHEMAEILREATPEVPVTTNFMDFFKPVDYLNGPPTGTSWRTTFTRTIGPRGDHRAAMAAT